MVTRVRNAGETTKRDRAEKIDLAVRTQLTSQATERDEKTAKLKALRLAQVETVDE